MAQVRLALSEPVPLAAGSFVIDFDPAVFGDVADVQVFSAAGDAIGAAKIIGRRVEVSFDSPSGGVGRLPGLPVATIAVPITAGAVNGVVSVGLGASPWKDAQGKVFPLSVAHGTVRVGAELTVGRVTPGGGVLPAGTVVRIGGTGFRPESVVEVPGVVVSRTAFVSPEEVTFTLGGAVELTGKTVRLRNPNGATAEFVAAQFVGATGSVPLFPLRTYSSLQSGVAANNLGGMRGIALLNSNSETVDVVVEIRDVGGNRLENRGTFPLAPGAVYIEPNLRALGVGSRSYAGILPTKPIRAVSLNFQMSASPDFWASEAGPPYTPYNVDPAPEIPVRSPVVGSIVNAASGAIGPVAPGQFISIHGTGVGVPVTIDGAAVTPVYSSLFQTNVQVPGSVKGTAVIGVGHVLTTLPVVAAAPGIFTLNGSGVGPGAVLNEDNSVNTPDNPAARESVLQIFGTGDGEQAVLMEASIGGIASEVLYGGSLTGLWQVNARVPADAGPGPRVPLLLRVGGVPTQSGVTVSVQ